MTERTMRAFRHARIRAVVDEVICHVLHPRSPSQVLRAIVALDAVVVADLLTVKRLSQERPSDKPVNEETALHAGV